MVSGKKFAFFVFLWHQLASHQVRLGNGQAYMYRQGKFPHVGILAFQRKNLILVENSTMTNIC